MGNELQRTVMGGADALERTAPGIARLPIVFVNAYFVGEPGTPWVLVDTGLPMTAPRTRAAAEARYGAGARPEAIILTHGHFDHAGSALELAQHWDVRIYAHPLELPFLTGRSEYPPQDPTIPGAISMMSRAFPHSGYDFGGRVHSLPTDGTVPGMAGWRWLHTPGHTPGHVSLFRESDRVLLAGDAVTTMDMDSWAAQVTRHREFDRPPAPFTPDWPAARRSASALGDLEPGAVAAGHGTPIAGPATARRLRHFADNFPVPARGRYVGEPARADERGVISIPPAPDDDFPRRAAMAALAAGAFLLLRRR